MGSRLIRSFPPARPNEVSIKWADKRPAWRQAARSLAFGKLSDTICGNIFPFSTTLQLSKRCRSTGMWKWHNVGIECAPTFRPPDACLRSHIAVHQHCDDPSRQQQIHHDCSGLRGVIKHPLQGKEQILKLNIEIKATENHNPLQLMWGGAQYIELGADKEG